MLGRRLNHETATTTVAPLAIAILLPLIPIIAEAGVLAVLPLLAIVLPLLCGRFPGESIIARVAARRRPSYSRRPASWRQPRRRPVRGLLRTRLLIAACLAERPPPSLTPA